jgi:thioredoxin reductase (NADPH)
MNDKNVEMTDVSSLIDTDPVEHSYDYDVIVLGGGSGGLAFARESAKLNAKVALLDFVKPSPAGSSWGLGGTCVNVGCIPKKLFHTASLLGEHIEAAKEYGWENLPEAEDKTLDWEMLTEAVQDHIGSLNWGYRVALREEKVEYINAYAMFIDDHTLEATKPNNEKVKLTARRFVIATGGRPRYPDVPGATEFCISSDDIFDLEAAPGKTLCIGASYVSLECAGFLTGLGFDTTVMVRSIFLRGFDQQIADMIGKNLETKGTKILRPCTPVKFEKGTEKKVKVTYNLNGTQASDEYDTVLLAIGRNPETSGIGLDKAGVKLNKQGKIATTNERTNVPHIYALGDIIRDVPSTRSLELTPVAIQAGKLLAHRLYNTSVVTMNYLNVPTTVFTPLEYGAIGYAEEEAVKKYGEENIEVYHSYYKPLEWTVSHGPDNTCYVKLICHIPDKERVIGFHILGPNAGEVTQGFAAAIHCGATKHHIDMTVGIHPTVAEEVTSLNITKRSGKTPEKTGC